MAEELKPDEARQGREGRPVLNVLSVSMILAVLVGVGIFTWFMLSGDSSNFMTDNSVTQTDGTATEPAPAAPPS
ncbi:hypothetical protein DFR52_102694 [Hoeflea marina]|uniref:Flagellar basal body-associated protein FliL n=1 Tax=Hoeflea marina TaxID=274592 RepID=A0A317PPG5_9HYPH|nr:hypothetical protein [Hoeflea marina]PWW02029.1 hypothetical protein DFR52_102694 [Hoeflea marina]